MSVVINHGTGVDQGTLNVINGAWTGQGGATIGTATLTTSWQKFNYSYTVPSNATELALQLLYFAIGTAGSNDYFDVTGVQLEIGSTTTLFENRLIGTELALCQRYYINIVEPTNTTDFNIPVVRESATVAIATIFLPVTMRTRPTTVGPNVGRVVMRDTAFNVSATAVSSIAVRAEGPNLTMITLIISHGSIGGTAVFAEWDILNTTTNYALSAEL